MLQADAVRKRIAGHDAPSISNCEILDINLPDYPARRKMNARDPHSVVSGFRVCTYVILPRRLGYPREISNEPFAYALARSRYLTQIDTQPLAFAYASYTCKGTRHT